MGAPGATRPSSATIVVLSAAVTSCESLTSHSCSLAARAPCRFRPRARGPARAPRTPSRSSAPRCPSRVSRRTPRITTSKRATTLRRSPHEPSRSMRHRRRYLPPRRRFGRRCKARSTGSSAKARRADATNTVGRRQGNRRIRPNWSDRSLEVPSRSQCWFGTRPRSSLRRRNQNERVAVFRCAGATRTSGGASSSVPWDCVRA